MSYRKTALASLLSSLVLTANAHADTADTADTTLSVMTGKIKQEKQLSYNVKNVGVYTIILKTPGALQQNYLEKSTSHEQAITQIKAEQASVLTAIQTIDSNAKVRNHVKLVNNMLNVQMTKTAAKTLESNSLVASVELNANAQISEEEEMTSDYAFLKNNDPGDAVTVAILSSGIDYTHAALGGSGERDDYDEAVENNRNAWRGFPTNTIIGGFDFASEIGNLDYNPIEQEEDAIDWADGTPFDAGHGTMMASIVLEHAPEAKLYAYKVRGVRDDGRVFSDHRDYNYPALEMAIDPNLDGNMDDKADIILIDNVGSSAFYSQGDRGISGAVEDILILRNISALGTLVVTSAGEWGEFPTYFNVGFRGATPEALTVGSVKEVVADEENGIEAGIVPSSFTPHGPVRGDFILKPDVSAFGEEVTAAFPGMGNETKTHTHHMFSAARVAGQAASILASRPELSNVELKNIIVNTADHNIDGGTITNTGNGFVDVDKAQNATSVVYQTANYQPNLALGFVPVVSSASVSNDLTLRNYADDVQTYSVSLLVNGEKENNAALTWTMPAQVSVPAQSAVQFTVIANIDGSKLTKSPIQFTEDYNIDNWYQSALEGYVVLTNTENPADTIKVPYLVMPKKTQGMAKDYDSTEFFNTTFSNDWAAMASDEWGYSGVQEIHMEFENASSANQTYYTMAQMVGIQQKENNKVGSEGFHIKNAGAGIYPDDRCESGQRLSLAASFFENFDMPLAKHADKIGWAAIQVGIYKPEMMEMLTMWGLEGYKGPTIEEYRHNFPEYDVASMWVEYDQDGKPYTWFIDYNKTYDPFNPSSRYTKSSLPTVASPGSNSIIANICVEDLYHEYFNSVDELNTDLAFIWATDRDARNTAEEDVIQFNPFVHGGIFEEKICRPFNEWICENYPDDPYAFMDLVTHRGFYSALTKVTGETEEVTDEWGETTTQPVYDWQQEVTLAPGERARFGLASDTYCTEGSFNQVDIDVECYPGAMLINPQTGFVSSTRGIDVDSSASVMEEVIPGQSFKVVEGVSNGTVIGNIARTTGIFFGIGGDTVEVFSLTALPGTPFEISTNGDITVFNSDAIDHEVNSSYIMRVYTKQGHTTSPEVEVEIIVSNANDSTPMQVRVIETAQFVQNQTAQADISASFRDLENDSIFFSSHDLPEGLTITNAGVIQGTPNKVGQFTSTIAVTDGINSSTTTVSLNVVANSSATPSPIESTNPANADSSSAGSYGFGVLMLLTLLGLRRRQ